MFNSNQFFSGGAAEAAFYPKTIDQSLRFEDGDSAYLSRTPASAGNRKTWTWSGWVKVGNVFLSGGEKTLFAGASEDFAAKTDVGTQIILVNSALVFKSTTYSVSRFNYTTSALLRDPSAWYHIVVAMDSTQATASERAKLYINGERVTNFSTETTLDLDEEANINETRTHYVGAHLRDATVTGFFDGYLAEVHFTDGTAYEPTDFGELRSGIWVPKDIDVTYGTNGFYLDFADSAAIGDDESGNTNDWTANNLVASDVVPDSPTNNFCTLNSVNKESVAVFAEGNLKYNQTTNVLDTSFATMGMPPNSGKWYWEVYVLSGNRGTLGLSDTEQNTTLDQPGGTGDLGLGLTGAINNVYVGEDNPPQTASDSFTTGDYVNICYDSDNGKMWFGINGTWVDSGDPDTDSNEAPKALSSVTFVPSASAYLSTFIFNFGQDSTFAGTNAVGGNSDANGIGDFKYTVPTDAKALCTANLPDPAIDPAQDNVPEDHFDVLASAGLSSYSGLSFAPDFLWNKIRTAVGSNVVADSIRGDDKRLVINSTNAEDTLSGYFNLTSNGFTTTYYNSGGEDYVYFFWKAGGTGVSNTDGSITSTVSANTDAGFSIVGYTGLGPTLGDGSSIGHGLNQAPELVIFKNRSASSNWFVMGYPTNPNFATDGSYLLLEGNAAMQTSSGNEIEIGSSVITFIDSGTTIADANPMIAYCFHSVDGYSKVGSYVGNGSTDGTFVYTGFRPKWIMVKSTGTQNWYVRDTERDPYNVSDTAIFPDLTNAETSTSNYDMDIVSNGFKHRYNGAGHNASGVTYIYLAFAEQPVKYSNAR